MCIPCAAHTECLFSFDINIHHQPSTAANDMPGRQTDRQILTLYVDGLVLVVEIDRGEFICRVIYRQKSSGHG